MIVCVNPDSIRLKPIDDALEKYEKPFSKGVSAHTYLWQEEMFGVGRAHCDRPYKVLGSSNYGLSSERYRKLLHKDTRTCLTMRNDRELHSISLNAVKAVNCRKYNIGRVESDAALHSGLQRVLDEAAFIVENHRLDNFRVQALEIFADIEVPFFKLATPLEEYRYPGTRGDNMRYPGHTLVLGTAKKPKLRMKVYDKGWEARKHPLFYNGDPIGRNQFTRVEFLIVGDKVTELFGGDTFDVLTLDKMREVFWKLVEPLYNDEVVCPASLGTSSQDYLARCLYYESLIPHGVSAIEPITPTLIRTKKSASYVRKQLREAQTLADSLKEESLRVLFNPQSPAPEIIDARV